MMKLLPIILVLVGAGAGLGAGAFLGGNSKEDAEAMAKDGEMEGKDKVEPHLAEQPHDDGEPYDANVDYVRLNNQFVVPIVEDERVASLIVMSLALETEQGQTDLVFEREPKLRDEFLTVLFAHARSGGFAGSFTDEASHGRSPRISGRGGAEGPRQDDPGRPPQRHRPPGSLISPERFGPERVVACTDRFIKPLEKE